MEDMKIYKWDNPLEWLSSASKEWDTAQLRNAILLVAEQCDSDAIQDIFQQEMNEDGYFTPILPLKVRRGSGFR